MLTARRSELNQWPPTKGTAWSPLFSTNDLQRKLQHDLHYFQPRTSNERYSMIFIIFNQRPPTKGIAWPPFFSTNDLQRKDTAWPPFFSSKELQRKLRHDLRYFQPTTSNKWYSTDLNPFSTNNLHWDVKWWHRPTTFDERYSMNSIRFDQQPLLRCTLYVKTSDNGLRRKVQHDLNPFSNSNLLWKLQHDLNPFRTTISSKKHSITSILFQATTTSDRCSMASMSWVNRGSPVKVVTY